MYYKNRWTYVNIYMYIQIKKSVVIIIVYYVSVATYVYMCFKNSVVIIRKLIYLRSKARKISWVYKHMWQPIDTPQ